MTPPTPEEPEDEQFNRALGLFDLAAASVAIVLALLLITSN